MLDSMFPAGESKRGHVLQAVIGIASLILGAASILAFMAFFMYLFVGSRP